MTEPSGVRIGVIGYGLRGGPALADTDPAARAQAACDLPDADIGANRVVVPLGAVGRAQRSELSRNVLGGPVRAV